MQEKSRNSSADSGNAEPRRFLSVREGGGSSEGSGGRWNRSPARTHKGKSARSGDRSHQPPLRTGSPPRIQTRQRQRNNHFPPPPKGITPPARVAEKAGMISRRSVFCPYAPEGNHPRLLRHPTWNYEIPSEMPGNGKAGACTPASRDRSKRRAARHPAPNVGENYYSLASTSPATIGGTPCLFTSHLPPAGPNRIRPGEAKADTG